jgi:acyl dehydratase
MAEQLYYDDVEVGMDLPSVTKPLSPRQFVRWAGASYDFTTFHYNHQDAVGRGLNGIVGQGALSTAFLGQVLTDWIGPRGRVLGVYGEYRGVTLPTDTLTVTGKVVEKKTTVDGNVVECELWCQNESGKRVTIGSGTVALPARKG